MAFLDDAQYASGIQVNNEFISEHAILEEMQYHPGSANPKRDAADALVIRTLLLQEAQRLNIVAVPLSLGVGRTEVEDEALIRSLIEHKVLVEPVHEEQCRDYYEIHATKFLSPNLYEPRHILYQVDFLDQHQAEVAREKAVKAIKTLSQQPWRFEELARFESECTSSEQGGYLGQFVPGQMEPEFEEALQPLDDGDLCAEPVQTRHGFHVIQMVRRESGRQLPFDAVLDQISDYLTERNWRYAVRNLLQELIRKADISGWMPVAPLRE